MMNMNFFTQMLSILTHWFWHLSYSDI